MLTELIEFILEEDKYLVLINNEIGNETLSDEHVPFISWFYFLPAYCMLFQCSNDIKLTFVLEVVSNVAGTLLHFVVASDCFGSCFCRRG